MRYLIIGILASLTLFRTDRAPAAAIDIIAPSGAGGVEGNSSAIPLDAGSPERFQQVYNSSIFGGLSQPIVIDQIVFRVDANLGRSFTATVSDVEVHLSTTSKQTDGLSSVFDQNVGSDDKIVIGRAPLILDGGGGGGVVGPWSILFDLRSNPFQYNPNAGNLLMDIKVFTGASTTFFDAIDVTGDSVSSVFGLGNALPTSGQPSSVGLATLFAVEPIPEPSTLGLLAFGLAAFGVLARRQLLRKAERCEIKLRSSVSLRGRL